MSAKLAEQDGLAFRDRQDCETARAIEHGPEKFAAYRIGAIAKGWIRNPRGCNHGSRRDRPRKDTQAIAMCPLRAAYETSRKGMAGESRIGFSGLFRLGEGWRGRRRQIQGGGFRFANDARAMQQPSLGIAHLDSKLRLQRRRRFQPDGRATGHMGRQLAADVAAIAGFRRAAESAGDDKGLGSQVRTIGSIAAEQYSIELPAGVLSTTRRLLMQRRAAALVDALQETQ